MKKWNIKDKLGLLQELMCFEQEIIFNTKYTSKYFPLNDMLKNMGNHTLIKPAFIKKTIAFTTELLK